jgi:hypothetical protein
MPEKYLEEKEGEAETKKIFTKKMNKFLNDYFKWIVAFIVLIILVFGFFALVFPKYQQTVRYINMANEQGKSDYEAKNTELTKIKELLSSYDGIDKKYIDKVNAIAPFKKNKEELFSEINYLISKNQLFLQSVSLGEIGAYQDNSSLGIDGAAGAIAGNVEAVSIEIAVTGTNYESFKNLLSALENNLRLMDVVTVSFSPVGKTTSLTINTYYTKQ